MSNLQQRDYYKIFTGSNQQKGLDKIYLGFEGKTSEIVLKKDNITSFHIPFFATVIPLSASTLIADGALPGPIPAMADRIFKKQSGYGKTTPWGNTTQLPDGTWLCSWLYSLPGQEPIWYDRFYNPGSISIIEALEQDISILEYTSSEDRIFYDQPSQMTLDPGVLYQYYHQGEQTAQQLIETFTGENKKRLRLYLDNWSDKTEDLSLYNNVVNIENFQSTWTFTLSDTEFTDRNILNFDNNSYIDCRVGYSEIYNLTNEFTLNFWIYNKQWSTAPYTQLVGNLDRGGYGVFYNNLKDFPYWCIPETTFGHLFYLNPESTIYLEKNIKFEEDIPMEVIYSGVDYSNDILVVDKFTQKLIKYNHLGDIIDNISLFADPTTAIIDGENYTYVLTNSGMHIYAPDFTLSGIDTTIPARPFEKLAFIPNGTLHREASCYDVKFDLYFNKWSLPIEGSLYCNDELLYTFPDNVFGVNLGIDPENNLWVITSSSVIYKFDTFTKKLLKTFSVGTDQEEFIEKYITFTHSYNRSTNTSSWYGYLINSAERLLYKLNLEGIIIQITDLPQNLDIRDPVTAKQEPNLLTFKANGDYSGYELRRIFNPIKYQNVPQIQFIINAKHSLEILPDIYWELSIPTDYFADEDWHLITCIYQNQELKLYVNGILRGTKQLPINYEIAYTYKNDLYIGTPCGKTENLNYEINSNSVIWNGYFDSLKIYDYALSDSFIQNFLRQKLISQDIVWNIPTAPLQYVEGVDRFFKHRLPGHKSPFFKIKITNTQITNPSIQERIKEEITSFIKEVKPAYSKLLSIDWVD
jgi:hypothetical protein